MILNLMTKSEIKARMFKHYVSLRKLNDLTATAYLDTDYDDYEERYWSIAMTLDTNGDVLAKIAYRPKKAIMTEYNMDFTMPYNEETSKVDDTEISISGDLYDIDNAFDWILKEYERIEEVYMGRTYGELAA